MFAILLIVWYYRLDIPVVSVPSYQYNDKTNEENDDSTSEEDESTNKEDNESSYQLQLGPSSDPSSELGPSSDQSSSVPSTNLGPSSDPSTNLGQTYHHSPSNQFPSELNRPCMQVPQSQTSSNYFWDKVPKTHQGSNRPYIVYSIEDGKLVPLLKEGSKYKKPTLIGTKQLGEYIQGYKCSKWINTTVGPVKFFKPTRKIVNLTNEEYDLDTYVGKYYLKIMKPGTNEVNKYETKSYCIWL